MIEYYEPSTDEDVEAIRAYAVASDARIAYLQLNMRTFNSPFWEWDRMYMFVYSGGAFNVRLPQLQRYLTTVYDCIGQLTAHESENELTADEATAARYLPNGWNTEHLADYCPAAYTRLSSPIRPLWRASWLAGCKQSAIGYTVLHPAQQRPLSAAEWGQLEQSTLDGWLEQQRQLFAQGWAEYDTGEFDRVFDIRQHVPFDVYPHNINSQPLATVYKNAQFQ